MTYFQALTLKFVLSLHHNDTCLLLLHHNVFVLVSFVVFSGGNRNRTDIYACNRTDGIYAEYQYLPPLTARTPSRYKAVLTSIARWYF